MDNLVFCGLHANKGVRPYNKRIENTQYIIIKDIVDNNKDYIGNNKEYSRSAIRNNKDITKE